LQRLAARVTEGDANVAAPSSPISAAKTPSTSPEAPADDLPTFTYRGVKYHPSALSKPSTDEPPPVAEGIYRGQRWQRTHADTSQPMPSSGQSREIKYRGHRVRPNTELDESKEA